MTDQYIVNERYGALDKKLLIKHQIKNSFNHTLTFWYKNKNVRNPEINIAHNQNREFISHERLNDHGGVSAKKVKGMSAI
jgi:hypothetical protein